jgi:hypothetical protein
MATDEGASGTETSGTAEAKRQTKWAGGFIRYDHRCKPTYIIRQMIHGHRFTVSTHTHSEAAAMMHLRRFEANPTDYTPQGRAAWREPIIITDRVILAFTTWSGLPKPQGGAGNSAEWVHQQKKHCEWWQAKLGKTDLRGAKLDPILRALEGAASRNHRIAVIKKLYGWLRDRDLIEVSEDPTLGKLAAHKVQPKERAAFPVETFEIIRNNLTEPWRSMWIVSASTGCHMTELRRFADDGKIEAPEPGRTDGAIAVIYIPRHKNRLPWRVPISQPSVREAAQRVLEHGSFDLRRYAKATRAACVAAKIEPVTAGRILRHTFIRHAITKGATIEQAGEFVGHLDPRTTRIYGQNAPRLVPTPAV